MDDMITTVLEPNVDTSQRVDSVSIGTDISAAIIIEPERAPAVTFTGRADLASRAQVRVEGNTLIVDLDQRNTDADGTDGTGTSEDATDPEAAPDPNETGGGDSDGAVPTVDPDNTVQATIVVGAMHTLAVAGVSTATASGLSGHVDVMVTGASTAVIAGAPTSLDVDVDDGSRLSITGTADEVTARVGPSSTLFCTGTFFSLVLEVEASSAVDCNGELGQLDMTANDGTTAVFERVGVGNLAISGESTITIDRAVMISGSIGGKTILRLAPDTPNNLTVSDHAQLLFD